MRIILGTQEHDVSWASGAVRILKFFILAACLASPSRSQSGNLLKNPGFEASFGPGDSTWQLDPSVSSNGQIGFTPDHVESGAFSLQLTPNAANAQSLRSGSGFGVAQVVPAAPLAGKSLYLSAWLQADTGSAAVVRIYALSSTGPIGFQEMRQAAGSAGMVLHRDIYNVPADSSLTTLIVACIVEGTAGAAYFDDINLSIGVPSSWLEGNGSPDPGSALEAAVSVEPAQVLRHLPATLYGTNLEWVWNGNGIWNPTLDALDPSALSLSQALGAPLYRFPGGFYADYYHWRDGVGPRPGRPLVASMPGGPTAVDLFGTDEALGFASSAGGNLLITVNVVTGTAQEAADWVRYVNQGGRKVTYWELGNESYASAGTAPASSPPLTPDVYAQRVVEFATAMRAVDPSIQIGAIADENYSWTAPRLYPDWTEQVLKTAGGEIDFLAVHSGYAPALDIDEGWNARTVYSAMLAAPLEILTQLNDVAARIALLVPNRADHIKIAVTEWGPFFDYRPTSRFVDHPKTLASGLFTASALAAILRCPQASISNFFKLTDANFMGAIGLRNGAFAAKSGFYALQLFTHNFGTELVATQTTVPAYDSPKVGWVDAQSAVPYLDVVSSLSANSSVLYLLAINKHFDRPIHARISTGSFDPEAAGAVFTLQGRAPDSNTGTQLTPGVAWARQEEIAPYDRFYLGSNDELTVTEQSVSWLSRQFEYTFPPASVTVIQLSRSRAEIPLSQTPCRLLIGPLAESTCRFPTTSISKNQ